MKSLTIAAMAFGAGVVLLAPTVTPATMAFASTTVSLSSTHVVAAAPITVGPSRSECLYVNFIDTGLASLQSAVTSFDTLTNSTVTCVSTYLNGAATWADWVSASRVTNPSNGFTSWVAEAPQSRQLILQVNLIPTSLENAVDPSIWEQSCANGDFNSYATQLGTNLVAAGLQNSVIRLGAEMNGVWESDFIGTTTQDQTMWATCFANEVTALRQAVGEHFLIDWNPNACKGAYTYANYYPGNAYVDIVGLDLYDVACATPNTPVPFAPLASEPFGLNDFEAFAAAQGKPMSFPEWALATIPSGGDPAYINGIGSTVANGNFAFETYFMGGGTNSKALPLGSSTPLSNAAYQNWFGPPSTISGIVTATGGGDLAGICVEAFLNGTEVGAAGPTAADGTYTISGLAPGSYDVLFAPGCGGGDYATQWYNGTAPGTQVAPGTAVPITVASPATGINAAMSAGTSISGTVSTAAAGTDLAGICVNAFPVGGTNNVGTAATSASDGTYTIEGLLPGSYYVEFLAGSCGGSYLTQWHNGTSTGAPSRSGASAVAVTTLTPATSIDAEMALGASISGTVTAFVSESDVAGVCVSATPTVGGSGGSAITAANGTYTVSKLAAGSYDVVVDPTCGGTITTSYASPQPTSGAVAVIAGVTSTDNARLVLVHSIVITITPSTSAPTNAVVGGSSYTPSATANSGDSVQIALDGSSTGCAINAGVVS
ncbi:MAG TPA: glycosyl hydrolase, partial [Acidimicrobiales bacterium]